MKGEHVVACRSPINHLTRKAGNIVIQDLTFRKMCLELISTVLFLIGNRTFDNRPVPKDMFNPLNFTIAVYPGEEVASAYPYISTHFHTSFVYAQQHASSLS